MKFNFLPPLAGRRLFAGLLVAYSLTATLAACGKKDKIAAPSLAVLSFTPSEAWTGDTIRIGGTGFQPDKTLNTVKFNGTLAIVTDATQELLTVKVPEQATTGKVTVTVGGNTVSSSQDFTINPGITLSADKIERGQTLTITGKGFNGSTEVWLNGKRLTVSSIAAARLEVVIPADALDGKIVVKKNGISQESTVPLHIYNYWTTFDMQSPPVGQWGDAKAFVYNNKIHIAFGSVLEGSWKDNDRIFSYDPATKSWQTAFTVPTSKVPTRKRPFLALKGNELYIGAGYMRTDCWVMDLSKSGEAAWTRLADLPASSYSDPAFVLNDKVYVALEMYGHKSLYYDPQTNGGAGGWVTAGDVDADGWILTGDFVSNNKAYVNDDRGELYEFDPSKSPATFTKKTLTGDAAKQSGTMFEFNGNGYCVTTDLYRLDMSAGKWVKKCPVPNDGVGDVMVVNNRVFGVNQYGHVYEYIAQ